MRTHQTRRMACHPCTRAKRACDRQDPQCGRCVTRSIECEYPPRWQKHPRRNNAYGSSTARALLPGSLLTAVPSESEGFCPSHLLQLAEDDLASLSTKSKELSSVPTISWSQQEDSTFLSGLLRLEDDILSGSSNNSNSDTHELALSLPFNYDISLSISDYDRDPSWFLTRQTWIVESNPAPVRTLPTSISKAFFQDIQGWLSDWVRTGHCPFIHRHLYAKGMPKCVQDAYTTLAAHIHRTPETEDLLVAIVNDRAAALLSQQSRLVEDAGPLESEKHLARTLALLVYTVIRLGDECPRQRSRAEATLPTLEQWCTELRSAAYEEAPGLCDILLGRTLCATQVAGASIIASSRQIYWDIGIPLDKDDILEHYTWKAWVLSETIRRIWNLAVGLTTLYQFLHDGVTKCGGSLSYTARRGLWDATSPSQWASEVKRSEDLLFIQALAGNELMNRGKQKDVDAFASAILKVIVTPEQLASWTWKSEDE